MLPSAHVKNRRVSVNEVSVFKSLRFRCLRCVFKCIMTFSFVLVWTQGQNASKVCVAKRTRISVDGAWKMLGSRKVSHNITCRNMCHNVTYKWLSIFYLEVAYLDRPCCLDIVRMLIHKMAWYNYRHPCLLARHHTDHAQNTGSLYHQDMLKKIFT